ncbi:class I adenylate-forming enzyme family protein [Sphingopyxis sp.]|jgi:acyl-CoA synthetase (AMP-forming)/AMP-acid ligase II|uniref:class I adenylate-forming enzyme family protein n=1 Tax=Sphingopyxis sp. TaxID=1908224 RepID=UPI002DE2F95F|nr:AMP-binding protein [Sphingopyxis sp.]
MAIIDFFDRGWRINPKGAAYIQDDRVFTFDEIRAHTCRIANALLAEGFAKETKAAAWAANDVMAWTCMLGVWRANMCVIPVGARSSAEENGYVLDQFDCEILFFQKYFADVIEKLKPSLPRIRHWICIDGDVPGAVSLESWTADQPGTPPQITYGRDDVVALSPTGGTTGMPKGVMNTHRSMQTFVAQFMATFHYDTAHPPVNLAAAPMTHSSGTLSLPCTARGGTVVVVTTPDPAVVLEKIAEHKVTELFLPPTVIYRLLDVPGLKGKDFRSLKYFLYGAAPMSVEKLKLAIETFGPVMAEVYGQTEAPVGITAMAPDECFRDGKLVPDDRLSSVGRPNVLTSVEIMDDDGRILPQGEAGEICLRGDIVMKGYYKDPQKTAETIVDGWLHTGDIGYLDDAGYLHITDRKKDMIISGGFNVYPSEIEQVIWGHGAVQDCAVIGVPDEQWGEAVKAVVELNPGQSATADELIALCKAKLGSVKAPKTIDFIDSLPRSPVGKVLKKDLRAAYWQDAGRRI